MRKRPIFSTSFCVSCGMCVQACPISSLSMDGFGMLGKYPNAFPKNDDDRCIGCGICAKVCPMEMITMEEAPEEGIR